MIGKISDIPRDVGIQKQLTDMHVKEWFESDVFHFRWWLLIFLVIAMLLIWWRLLDKSRIFEISLFAILSAIVFMGVHEYGEELVLWEYPTDLIPIFPPLSSFNLVGLPFAYSLVYQRFGRRKSFLCAAVITTAFICFLIEPLLSWGGFYCLLHWNYFFSAVIYFTVTVIVRAVIKRIYAIAKQAE
ncbi:CBO0543 family protein [Caproicibacter sp. BJN0012]|uniref:CBO0543 family protein n=1 Tax=Caproicibacter sp. BJN0012 TaxID=3110227 RepID=UPI002E1519B4